MLTAVIVVGAIAMLGIGIYAATGDERELNNIKKDIEKINAEIEKTNLFIVHFDSIISKVDKAIDNLEGAQNDFKNGGCVYQGVPYANDEFNSCIDNLDSASTNLLTVKSNQQKKLDEAEIKLKELETRKKEVEQLIAQRNAALAEASKNQHARRDGALGGSKTSSSNKGSSKNPRAKRK